MTSTGLTVWRHTASIAKRIPLSLSQFGNAIHTRPLTSSALARNGLGPISLRSFACRTCALQRTQACSTGPRKSPRRSIFTYPAPRKLTDIMKVPLVKNCDPAQIKVIWDEYHKDRADAFGIALSATQYRLLRENARFCKIFIYPVFRDQGYMTVLSQFQDNCFLFTFLEDYRRDPQRATPWMCVTLYDEFLADKGLGLLRADVGHHLTRKEGTHLTRNLVEYYSHADRFRDHVLPFNKRPQSFSFDKYLRSVPRIPT